MSVDGNMTKGEEMKEKNKRDKKKRVKWLEWRQKKEREYKRINEGGKWVREGEKYKTNNAFKKWKKNKKL